MNHTIIKNFNQIVGKEDTTYHLGDFTLRGPENWPLIKNWVHKLNGTHILILGNHDKLNPFAYVECGFQSVHTYLKVDDFHLVHDPAVCNVALNEPWLCGHIHRLFTISNRGNIINVCVDVWNFYPVPLDHLKSIIPRKEK
jgi:calcineurin-like phosphoesterase family protein